MTEYVRTQVMIEKKQRQLLGEIAEQAGVSFSELVREFLDSQLRTRTYEEMKHAAENLYADYAHDENLTGLIALDGEDFING